MIMLNVIKYQINNLQILIKWGFVYCQITIEMPIEM